MFVAVLLPDERRAKPTEGGEARKTEKTFLRKAAPICCRVSRSEDERISQRVLVHEGGRGGLTTQVILLVELKLKSKKAPKQVETLLVVPKGPRLKSSEVMLYDCRSKGSASEVQRRP